MDTLTEKIATQERQVWDALVAGNGEADRLLLDPAFLGVYPDGFADRDAHCDQLADGPSIHSYTLDQITVKAVGADHAMIAYHATFQRGSKNITETMYVSSLWEKQVGRWINIFSQDTPAT